MLVVLPKLKRREKNKWRWRNTKKERLHPPPPPPTTTIGNSTVHWHRKHSSKHWSSRKHSTKPWSRVRRKLQHLMKRQYSHPHHFFSILVDHENRLNCARVSNQPPHFLSAPCETNVAVCSKRNQSHDVLKSTKHGSGNPLPWTEPAKVLRGEAPLRISVKSRLLFYPGHPLLSSTSNSKFFCFRFQK